MSFAPTPRVQDLLARIVPFVDERVLPLERALLDGRSFVDLLPELDALRDEARALGAFAPQVSAALGGGGLTVSEFAWISEALGRTPLGHYVFNCQAPDAGNIELLAEHGTPEQKERWLKPLVAGRIRSCFTMTEPEMPGSNPVMLAATAVRDGDDWVIDGHKWYATAADGAALAIAMVVTEPEADRPHARASMILVPTDTEGFRIVRNLPVMGEAGSGWASHSEIRYERCRVPASNLLGRRGEGFVLAQDRLGPGRIHHCMRWIGICERALDLMCRHVVARQLAPFTPLSSRQTIQTWIAESRAEIDASRLMVLDAAWRIDTVGAKAAKVEISSIKFFVAATLQRVLDRALQALGARGMVDDQPIAWWYRHERAARIYDGPDEVHKAVVAREVLKKYDTRRS